MARRPRPRRRRTVVSRLRASLQPHARRATRSCDAPLDELIAEAGRHPRRRPRRPHHLLAQGLHPAHDAVPRPLRLLHVRQAAGAPRRRRTSRSTRCSTSRAAARRSAVTRRCSRSAKRPRHRYPAAAEWLAAHGLRVDGRLPRRGRAARCSTETGLLPHANAGALPQAELERLRAVSPSQGMMIETLAARLGEPGGPHHGAPDKTPERRLATLEAAGRAASRSPPGSSSASARRAPSGSTRCSRSRRRARAPRARAGGDRPELPAEAGHRDAPRRRVRSRRVALVDRRGAARARPDDAPAGAAEPRRRPRARSSPPASTTGAASRPSRPIT